MNCILVYTMIYTKHIGEPQYEAMEIASKLNAFTAGPYISKEQPRKIK